MTGISAGPGPSRPAIVVARSCRSVPMTSPVVDSFDRREEARQHRVDVGARHRELGRPEVVHRMTERVDAVAVDVRDRAGAAQQEVAVDEGDADGVARLQRTIERHLARPQARRGAPSERIPGRGTRRRASSPRPGSKPDMTSGVAIGRSIVPRSSRPPTPATAVAPTSRASQARSANGRFQFSARGTPPPGFRGVSGNSSARARPPAAASSSAARPSSPRSA